MLLYRFNLDTRYAGRPLRVFAADGSEVSGSPFTLDGNGDYVASLAEGSYVGKVDNPAVFAGDGVSVANGILDIPASIAAGGGGSAADTAHFIGTATSDTSGDNFPITWTQDPDFAEASWARVVGGNVQLDGPLIIRVTARQGGVVDCTGATGFSLANTPILVEGFIKATTDGSGPNNCSLIDFTVPLNTSGTVFDVDAPSNAASDATANVELIISGTNDVFAYDADGSPVTDGVFNSIVAITVTRLPMPALPTLG